MRALNRLGSLSLTLCAVSIGGAAFALPQGMFTHARTHVQPGPGPGPGGGGPPPPPANNFTSNDHRVPLPYEEYRFLDNVEKSWVNLNNPPVRPMIITAGNLHTFAVNTHDSTVLHLDASVSPLVQTTYRVPWGPVALASWVAPDLSDKLLVVCRGSHVLAVLDMFTGDIEGVIQLDGEPGDILVDEDTDMAYVSCSGSDNVLEVDLVSSQVTQRFDLPSKHPVFLAWDGDRVLVAPQVSGNNSTFLPIQGLEVLSILDLTDPSVANIPLPDEDLFGIDPLAGTVEAVATGTGTLLYGMGINPVTGAFWQLNTEHLNKDPNKQTEPLVNGEFALNRLTITTLPIPGDPPVSTHTFFDLDDTDLVTDGQQVDTSRTVGQPYGLSFSSTGFALVTGLGTDNVTLLDQNGNFVLELDTGSIPRYAIFDTTETLVLVHCWGNNTLEVFSIAPFNPLPILTFSLGNDPTPVDVAEGRQIAYSSSNSLSNNLSCFTCHREGDTDFLLWNLSGPPEDRKGPLVTQTLRGISKVNPFHWRGERSDLIAFNGAFSGLLGGAELSTGPGSDFEKFQKFVFSIENMGNPNQEKRRLLKTDFDFAPNGRLANAANGQRLFIDVPTIGAFTCADCHSMPTSTNNESQNTSAANIDGHANHMKVAPFSNRAWAKDQPTATYQLAGGQNRTVAVLGAGLVHGGKTDHFFDFVDGLGALGQQGIADLWGFIRSWDSGLAAAVHRAVLVSPDTVEDTLWEALGYLIPQAQKRNCDVVCFGTVTVASNTVEVAWYYDRDQDLFIPEDTNLSPQPGRYFVEQARLGNASNTFLGVPVGMGPNFAIDFDGDDLPNGNEVAELTGLYDQDSDNDGFIDGQEIEFGSDPLDDLDTPNDTVDPVISDFRLQWITGRVARFSWETSEPTSFLFDYSTPNGTPSSISESDLTKTRSVLLRDLLPSTAGFLEHTYTGTLTVTDAAGRQASLPMPTGATTEGFRIITGPIFENVIGTKQWTNLSTNASELTATAEFRVDFKAGGPPAIQMNNAIAVARVLVNGQLSTNWTNTGPNSFKVNGVEYGTIPLALEGPFLISDAPSALDGLATMTFTQPGLNPGDVVSVNLEYVVSVDGAYDPLDPDFGFTGNPLPLAWWSFPETPVDLRKIETTF